MRSTLKLLLNCAVISATAILAGIYSANAQAQIVKNGKASGQIVVTSDNADEMEAAKLAQRFIGEVSGAEMNIVRYKSPKDIKPGSIIISRIKNRQIKEDGFGLQTSAGSVYINYREGKGAVYGIVTLLENYLGIRYWGENEYSLEKSKNIDIPAIDFIDNPAFRYRQSQNYALATDPVYKMWNRLESPGEVFAGGYWVHTFDRLLPSAVYGKEHPEYYSYFKGKRHPGKASQWCLTNHDVLEIVAQKVDSIFRANPGKNIISVSQNDGNYTNCTCPDCAAIDQREGGPSGSLIHFMNKLAERFPDKEISTLAYLYTMKPPKHLKPRPNVNIMLCDIDCDREVTLTENASGREFVEAMEGWSAITDNIFVWDYGINFDCYAAPFPNFHILRDNIKLFRANHANMHFSQIASVRGGDFAEMRTWLVSKLMWNPEQDTDSLMQVFINGYYGKAAPYIYQYVKMQEGALLGSGLRLWIYDSPVSHKDGMLRPALMRRYNRLFGLSEAAVADSETHLTRVRRTRLPLQYSELELARTEVDKDTAQISRQLDLLERRSAALNAQKINERNNTYADYCRLYRQRYMRPATGSLAYGAKVDYIVQPTQQRYADMGKTALTDGLFGGASYQESWVGWEAVDAAFVIDLGEEKTVSGIETDFLHQLGAWILPPQKVVYSLSTDGQNFTLSGSYDLPEDSSPQVKFVPVRHELARAEKTRYIRIDITGTKVCPHWHYGVGNPCWFFIDEVTVF